MVILMKANKQLVISKETRIYQRENVVDKLKIYVPATYDTYDLSQFSATLSYVNPGNDAYLETLEWGESDKDEFLLLALPATTRLTAFAGEVVLHLEFVWYDGSTGENGTSYILKSSDLTIKIEKWEDYFRFVPDDAFSAIDNKILALNNETQRLKSIEEALEKEIPDDVAIDTDSKLHLTIDGEAIGNGVEVLRTVHDVDGSVDGIIHLEDVTGDEDIDGGDDDEGVPIIHL